MSDPWKRKEEYKENRYPQQLEIQLNKTVEATDEEWDEWQEKELNWWAERQIPIVAFMAFVQLFVFGGMLMAFVLIGKGLK
jgi:hypothetical protein|tara:strand:+ start:394 stop:636 length:243 start_codon:yes stop_codon:yes gene_type:complete